MKILWINPIGNDGFDLIIGKMLKESARDGTSLDVVSLPKSRPLHLEYHAYEGLVVGDIVNIVYDLSENYDGIVIGCFYDVGLREAREVSKRAVVVAPCQASLVFATHLGNSFSVLVGRRKWIPKMRENIHMYGQGERLASMRPLKMGVYDFQADLKKTAEVMMEEGRKAVDEDGAEVIILGCTIEFGFHETMQKELGVPVVDAVLAPFKLVEMFAETAGKFGWYPSRKWGSEAPPLQEVKEMALFENITSIGNLLKNDAIQ